MGFYFEILLGILVISKSCFGAKAQCDPIDCRHLRDRLETLETVVQGLISIVASQKTGEELRGILSASLNSSRNKTVSIFGEDQRQNKIVVNLVNNLKGAVRCSLANLLDINRLDDGINPSGKIEATLGENNLLQIVWTPLSIDCIKFSSGVWIRVFESDQQQPSSADSYLTIPQKCLKRHANASFTITLPSSSAKLSGNTCHFDLKDALIQCRVYTIEVVPNYQSLTGKQLSTTIVIPPANNNSTESMESLISIASNSSSLTLKWKDNSGCAPRLTGLNFKIFPDGEENAENTTMSLRIPRDCLEQPTAEIFSLSLSEYQTCPVKWMPLDPCRKYKIEIKSEYSNWTRAPFSWEIFTEAEDQESNQPILSTALCPSVHFYCDGDCKPNGFVCDGDYDCSLSEIDEQYCDSQCEEGFRCGRQCVPINLVCDGKYDCIDGSDEIDPCDYPKKRRESCKQLTNFSGQFSSQIVRHKASRNNVLLTVQTNHSIWLNFNGYVNHGNRMFKIYDGPYLTSPLLLSHNGTNKPPFIRSSSNNLYIEFPVMQHFHETFKVQIDYTSMDIMEPFVLGCGGYVYDEGVVSSPNNFSDKVTECVWFVETQPSDNKGMFLKKSLSPNVTTNDGEEKATTITVYDGWNSTGRVLYNGEISSSPETSDILYSISHKMMIRFTRPTGTSLSSANWNVSTISLHQKNIVGSTGKIESPNYPASYPNSYDYRWHIVTEPGTKVQLIFAFFNTQERFDFVFVYDGPTVYSRLLLQKSGWESIPFTVGSSSNELLVRFTSDDDITFPGFLALYSAV